MKIAIALDQQQNIQSGHFGELQLILLKYFLNI